MSVWNRTPAAKSVMERASTRTFQCSGYCRRHTKGVPTSAYPRRRPRCAAFSLDHQRVSRASTYPAIHTSSVWPGPITGRTCQDMFQKGLSKGTESAVTVSTVREMMYFTKTKRSYFRFAPPPTHESPRQDRFKVLPMWWRGG